MSTERTAQTALQPSSHHDHVVLRFEDLRRLCLDQGADDVGFVSIENPALSDQRQEILRLLPTARSVISFVCRMNPGNIRSVARSVSNVEFHHTTDAIERASRAILDRLRDQGVSGAYPPAGFPMEMDRYPGRIWTVAHKPLAEAAGLGRMGIHRNVIHPRFGSFVMLGAVVIDSDVTRYSEPIDYSPCVECKLCVAACPVGAIGPDGHFDFAACATHNYREFMGGFVHLLEDVANSRDEFALRRSQTDSELSSWWQSLAKGPNYKAAYCLSVCPAGEDVIAPYLADKAAFNRSVVRPLREKVEPVYVVPGSDADTHVRNRFPHKKVRQVRTPLRPVAIEGFLRTLPLAFNRHRSEGLSAVYHFRFSGPQAAEATVTIRDKRVQVQNGLCGAGDVTIEADGETWIRFVRRETGLLAALLTRRIRIKGSIRLMASFAKCFPR